MQGKEEIVHWKVSILMYPVKKFFTSSFSLSPKRVGRCFMHWASLLQSSSDENLVFDAVSTDSKLSPQFRKHVDEASLHEMIYVGCIDCSYEHIMRKFRESSQKEKAYNTLYNNCQTWLLYFLQLLGVTIPQGVKSIAMRIDSSMEARPQKFKEIFQTVAKDFQSCSKRV